MTPQQWALEQYVRRLFWRTLLLIALLVGACVAFAAVPPEAARYQRDLTRNARVIWGMSAPISTFAAQVHQESRWRADAQSPYAHGLAQFTPSTADWISQRYALELGERQPFNPAWALRALVRYDRHLWERVKPYRSECDRFLFALSDYNGGAGWRQKRQRLSDAPGDYYMTSGINPGIHPRNQRENETYPTRIVFYWQPIYERAGWGIGVC